jgi:hypothetical protein
LTFRTSKKHKTQESSKVSSNALKLVSRFQRFLDTGVGSKKDLKDVDARFFSQVSQQGDKILTLLDQLREITPKKQGPRELDQSCEFWAKWLSSLNSKENLGYSSLKTSEGSVDSTQGVLLESVVDIETHLFQTLFAFKSLLSNVLKESLNDKTEAEISNSARDIIDTYQTRQRMLGKLVNQRHQ